MMSMYLSPSGGSFDWGGADLGGAGRGPNPLSLELGEEVSIGDDEFTRGLRFTVTSVNQYSLKDYSFTDYYVHAPCSDWNNAYAANNEVLLRIRALTNEKGQLEKVLFWEEDPQFVGNIMSKVGSSSIQHSFGDGIGTYTLSDPSQKAGTRATVIRTGADAPGAPESVQYWLYQRPWQPSGEPEAVQYLLVEKWPDGVLITRGYDMLSDSLQKA